MKKIEKLVDKMQAYKNYAFASDTDKIILSMLLELGKLVEEISKAPHEARG